MKTKRYNAGIQRVFDEGIKSWARTALENGFRFLPIEGAVLKKMRALGFRPTVMAQVNFHGLRNARPGMLRHAHVG